jgi:HSP20 family molecular chaperone IbpA
MLNYSLIELSDLPRVASRFMEEIFEEVGKYNTYEVVTDKETTRLEIEMPGIKSENIRVESGITGGQSIVSIKWKDRKGKEQQRSYKFSNHDVNNTKADLKNGLLIVTVPIKINEKLKEIPIFT